MLANSALLGSTPPDPLQGSGVFDGCVQGCAVQCARTVVMPGMRGSSDAIRCRRLPSGF